MMNLSEKRVCVTGGAGFLGSHVVAILRGRGCSEVFVPRRRDYDLTTFEGAERMFQDARPDVVFHLAAVVGGIGANRANPGQFFYENAMMGLHVVEAARRHRVEKLVVAGTICSYPKLTPVPFREEELWNGYPEETNAPYGIAKKALLVMCQAYRAQYGLNAVFLMPVNLYGPRDSFHLENCHVIPALLRKFVEAQEARADEIECWGDGSPTREFLFVEDAAEGLVLAAERYDGAEPVNLGSGWEISIRELAETMAASVGFAGRLRWDASRPNGQPRRQLDVERAKQQFGFAAQVRLAEGLARTVAWYRADVGSLAGV